MAFQTSSSKGFPLKAAAKIRKTFSYLQAFCEKSFSKFQGSVFKLNNYFKTDPIECRLPLKAAAKIRLSWGEFLMQNKEKSRGNGTCLTVRMNNLKIDPIRPSKEVFNSRFWKFWAFSLPLRNKQPALKKNIEYQVLFLNEREMGLKKTEYLLG